MVIKSVSEDTYAQDIDVDGWWISGTKICCAKGAVRWIDEGTDQEQMPDRMPPVAVLQLERSTVRTTMMQ